MPVPGLPPTPASSAEFHAKDQSELIEDLRLPPAALNSLPSGNGKTLPSSSSSSTSLAAGNESGPAPTAGNKRKRRSINADMQAATAGQAAGESTFSLPPPPSRSRKIIQVQPEDARGASKSSTAASQSRKKNESKARAGGPSGPGVAASAGGTSKSTAASRKTARKTAHSIIERRRRSKMNDEFETLKDLVPAARGQNMHKLAILQAGIEYVRYLEDCIQGLQGAKSGPRSLHGSSAERRTSSGPVMRDDDADVYGDEDNEEDEEEDDEMDEDDNEEDSEIPPASTPRASRPGSTHQSQGSVSNTPSPAIYPLHSRTSTASSYALSTGSCSPAFLPSLNTAYSATSASSTLPSPALLPNDYKSPGGAGSGSAGSADYHALQAHAKKALAYHGEADQEVIATLTMMGTERRRSQEEKDRMDGTRGMSVRDLLST